MTVPFRRLLAVCALLLPLALAAPAIADPVSRPGGPFVPPNQETVNQSSFLSNEDVGDQLHKLEKRSKGALRVEVVGHSGEGRPLYAAFIGTGDTRMWVQGRIHGNEPYGPDAALSFLKTLVSGGKHAREVLGEMSFAVIPMYNPDGAAAFIRQDTINRIDLNRDWGVDQDIFDRLNAVRASRNQDPLPQSVFDRLTQYTAVESQAFWYLWADFKPHYMVDIHHQGTYHVDDTDEMTTFSMGISLDPGMLTDEQWDDARRMAVVAADAAGKRGTVNVTRYPYINIPEGVTSAAQLNPPGPDGEYADWRSTAMFFESRGGIGQKSRGYLIGQNVTGLWAITDAIADGSLDSVDADRWAEIPARGSFISSCAKFPQQCDW